MPLCNNFIQKRGVGLFSRVGLFSGDYTILKVEWEVINLKCAEYIMSTFTNMRIKTSNQAQPSKTRSKVSMYDNIWVSLGKPHTNVTALHMHDCVYASLFGLTTYHKVQMSAFKYFQRSIS